MSAAADKRGWLAVTELGSVWGIRFVVLLCMVFGRGVARGFLRAVVFYYVLFNARARAASRTYFQRLSTCHPGTLRQPSTGRAEGSDWERESDEPAGRPRAGTALRCVA